MILDLLHGYVHQNPEKLILLAKNQYFVMPIVNIDGSWQIMDHYLKHGNLIYKRKNNNVQYE
jgi:hypothetical protein